MTVAPGTVPPDRDGDDVGNYGDVGVLFCDGPSGRPTFLRDLAEGLAAAGHTVRGPAGRRGFRIGRPTWYAGAETTFHRLRRCCRMVVAAGWSTGGALALRLAQCHGPTARSGLLPGLDSVILVAPRVRLRSPRTGSGVLRAWFTGPRYVPATAKPSGATGEVADPVPLHVLHSTVRGYRSVTTDLPVVSQPPLLFRSTEDHAVPANRSALVLDRVTSARAEDVILRDSGAVASTDEDPGPVEEQLLRHRLRFLRALADDEPVGSTTAVRTTAGGSR